MILSMILQVVNLNIKRCAIVYLSYLFVFVLLIFALYYIIYGNVGEKAKEVSGARTSSVTLYNSKGIIYDRNLCPLAGNQAAYYLVINPRGFDKTKMEYICSLTDTDSQEFSVKLNKETPFVVMSYFEPETVEGVYVYEGTTRYAQSPSAVHVLGYLDSECINGVSGVEKSFSEFLSGYSSVTKAKYISDGRRGLLQGLGITVDNMQESLDGIVLTLDKRLSDFTELSMDKYIERGCVCVMDCNNGEILALESSPDFEQDDIQQYLDSDNGELINLALKNNSVGSVFKMIMATCALQNNLGDFKYNCTGGIDVGGRIFACHNKDGHKELGLSEAFATSCNSYFIALGQLLGYDRIIETSQLFGLDLSIDIIKGIYADSGKLPDDTGIQSLANLSIGQGKLLLSPLSVARVTAAMCNGGYLVNPTLYKSAYVNGLSVNESEYNYKSVILNNEIANELRQMCIDCVSDGTGQTAQPTIDIAGGKTASAQTGKYNSDGKEQLNTYFTGFYPADSPKYVITVFAVDGVSGSQTCAPVFAEICDFISQNY